MARLVRFAGLGVLVALVWPITLQAQYNSDLVGFNSDDHGGVPIDDPATSQEMFQIPQFSGSTVDYILLNDPNNPNDYSQNSAFRAGGLHTEGDAALQVLFKWVDPSDSHAWVRLTTWNGEWYPNPCLDTRGKVRFKITNESEFFDGDIGVCIGIRETGAVDVDQLGDGGTSGPIEWVGVTGVMTDPNYPGFIKPIPAITLPPSGTAYQLEWDLSTGKVRVDSGSWVGTIAGFTGNGTLADCPNNRGTLEHVAITNVTSDPAVEILFAIDELQFEATVPDPTPPPTIQAPVVDTDTEVLVNCLADATSAELFIDPNSQGSVTPIGGVATFTGLSLEVGNVLTATQTANGVTSDLSVPVVVYAAGTALAENFDGYGSQDDLELIWSQTDPTNDLKLLLTTGSASSCENMVVSDYASAPSVSKLYYYLGAVNGSDAEPLLVTYRFKHDYNSTNARARFELTSALTKEYGALGFAFTNDSGLNDAWREQYTSMTNSPVPIIDGYVSDYFYYDYALTGIDREPGVWHKMQIEVLSDVVNFYIDDQLANPRDPNDPNDPNGLWPDGVPRVNDLDFQYIILGVGYSNNGPAMMYDDISVTIGGTALPFGDPNPVDSPTIAGPLFPDGTLVDVTDIDPNDATDVTVYVDGVEAASETGPFPDGTATLTVPNLYDGETVTVTQTVGAIESCFSWPVVVGVPAPTVDPILVMGDVSVEVSDIEENLASAVAVYQDLAGDLLLLGSVSNPTTDPVDVTVPALATDMVIVATQTIGGVEGPPSEGVEVEAEPPAIVEWIETSELPFGLTDHALVYLNGYIYCLGGRTGSGSGTPSTYATDYAFYAPVNCDGSIGAWQQTTSLPEARACHGAAAYNGRVYVWGGWTVNWPTRNTCWYADPNPDGTLGAWQVSAVTIPDDVGQIQMDSFGRGDLIYNDTLYIINGERNDGSLSSNCYYSTITGGGDYSPWVLTSQTESVCWFHGVAVIEGTTGTYIHRVAGNHGGTTEREMFRTTIESDGSLGTWVEDPRQLPGARYEHACVSADNKWIFAICGLYGGTPQNSVYYTAVDPNTGALVDWRDGPDYPETVSRNRAVSYSVGNNTYILVVGGGPYDGTDGNRTPRCYYAVLTGVISGDVDDDGDVDLSDLAALLGSYNQCVGDPYYNPAADFDGNCCVNLSDLAELLGHYGEGT